MIFYDYHKNQNSVEKYLSNGYIPLAESSWISYSLIIYVETLIAVLITPH